MIEIVSFSERQPFVRRRIEVGIDEAIKSLVSFDKRHSVMRKCVF